MKILSYSLVLLIPKAIKTADNEFDFKANLSTINIEHALTNLGFVLAFPKSTRHSFRLNNQTSKRNNRFTLNQTNNLIINHIETLSLQVRSFNNVWETNY